MVEFVTVCKTSLIKGDGRMFLDSRTYTLNFASTLYEDSLIYQGKTPCLSYSRSAYMYAMQDNGIFEELLSCPNLKPVHSSGILCVVSQTCGTILTLHQDGIIRSTKGAEIFEERTKGTKIIDMILSPNTSSDIIVISEENNTVQLLDKDLRFKRILLANVDGLKCPRIACIRRWWLPLDRKQWRENILCQI